MKKSYSTRTNAQRAAKSAGIENAHITAHKDGTFSFKSAIKEPAKRVRKNGVAQPGPGTVCAAVWEWHDKHLEATAQESREAGDAQGINPNTAKTQRARWRTFHGKGNLNTLITE